VAASARTGTAAGARANHEKGSERDYDDGRDDDHKHATAAVRLGFPWRRGLMHAHRMPMLPCECVEVSFSASSLARFREVRFKQSESRRSGTGELAANPVLADYCVAIALQSQTRNTPAELLEVVRGFRVGTDAKGRDYTAASIPGTGLYNRAHYGANKPVAQNTAPLPDVPPYPQTRTSGMPKLGEKVTVTTMACRVTKALSREGPKWGDASTERCAQP
jgi:hypothetical protein